MLPHTSQSPAVSEILVTLAGVLLVKNIDEAAIRILKNRTGAENIYLQQFYTFGNLNRSEKAFEKYPDTLWNKQRFVSIGYYALADFSKVDLIIDELRDVTCILIVT